MSYDNISRIELKEGDISQLAVDAVVNAANQTLLGGGGVDGAIHRAAGPGLVQECRGLGGCRPGEAKITGGYNLPAKYVIHTVGPIYRGRDEDARILTACYQNSLELAVTHQCRTIGFPAISCGAYRYPIEDACKIAIETVLGFLASDNALSKVIFVLFLPYQVDIYDQYLIQYKIGKT